MNDHLFSKEQYSNTGLSEQKLSIMNHCEVVINHILQTKSKAQKAGEGRYFQLYDYDDTIIIIRFDSIIYFCVLHQQPVKAQIHNRQVNQSNTNKSYFKTLYIVH
jgi:hypothetical protein